METNATTDAATEAETDLPSPVFKLSVVAYLDYNSGGWAQIRENKEDGIGHSASCEKANAPVSVIISLDGMAFSLPEEMSGFKAAYYAKFPERIEKDRETARKKTEAVNGGRDQ